ncbi:putative transcriptional regulator [Archaeoglobus sulfaticallidus PM70-1]|uniref:Putative transcriptional regulator n=1 Tax=Archaeoglobus sulfaticallidus PM70-1 TaxID=387631 RepID=N0BG58_9EURY|nr:helix-turn-helix domain-containing protein [Archaeoglobus sulfaticallidus]AGK61282.1 putative transcriptional regulator [Archaeoglobus sulfaticallidus PM70-1]
MHERKTLEELREELKNDKILTAILGMNATEVEIYFGLIGKEMSIDEISERFGIEKSSAYKCVGKLYRKGLLKRKKMNFSNGYNYLYISENPQKLMSLAKSRIAQWCEAIDSFSNES